MNMSAVFSHSQSQSIVKQLEFQRSERETLAITAVQRFLQFFKTDSNSAPYIWYNQGTRLRVEISVGKESKHFKSPPIPLALFLCNEKDDA